MTEINQVEERKALQSIMDCLAQFDDETCARIIKTVETFFGVGQQSNSRKLTAITTGRDPVFSIRTEQSPKGFLFEKQPKTDIERVACLAYYLTHYRDTPHFKTVDISILNTEAAQLKFSNAALAVGNATSAGFLTQAGKGLKQISAIGEMFVDALPDREGAQKVRQQIKRRIRKKSKNQK